MDDLFGDAQPSTTESPPITMEQGTSSSSTQMPVRTHSSSSVGSTHSSSTAAPPASSSSSSGSETEFTKKKRSEIAKRAADLDAKHEAARKEMGKSAERALEKMRGERAARIAAKAKENRAKQQEFINSMKKPQISHLVDLEAQTPDKERFRTLLKSGKTAAA